MIEFPFDSPEPRKVDQDVGDDLDAVAVNNRFCVKFHPPLDSGDHVVNYAQSFIKNYTSDGLERPESKEKAPRRA